MLFTQIAEVPLVMEAAELLSDMLPYLSAVLGLLLVWQYHEKQVLAGRIQAFDIFDRSGIRMYVFMAPADDQVCEGCREMHGMVFLPSRIANREFRGRRKPCSGSGKCVVVMAGLYGAWLQARKIVQRLREAGRAGYVRLSPEDLIKLVQGNWESSVSASTDRLAVMMLTGMNVEIQDAKTAIDAYQMVIDEAKEVHDLPLVVPAYLRLADLLIREQRPDDAMTLIESFEKRYPRNRSGPYFPKETQRGLMALKKSRLKAGSIANKAVPQPTAQAAPTATPVPHAS